MSSRRLRAAALAAACALVCPCVPSVSSAQRPATDSITLSREMLVALLGQPGLSAPEIAIGRLPAGYPAALVQSPRELLVGMTFGPDLGATVVLTIPGAPDAAAGTVVARLTGDGWTPAQGMGMPSGGFAPSAMARPAMLCRDSTSLFVTATPRDGGGSHVRVTRTDARRAGMCGRGFAMGRDPADDFPIPTLTPPAGARTSGGGSRSSTSGMGGDTAIEERLVSTVLETPLSPDALADHYVAQLVAAGWTSGAAVRTDGVATRVLTRRDARGRDVHGILTAITLPGTTQRDVSLRALRRATR